MKVRKKDSGQPSPAEEPEGPGEGGDSRAGAARGLLPPNRVGQEEPVPTGMATPYPGEKGLWGAAGTTGTTSTRSSRDVPQGGFGTRQSGSMLDHQCLLPLLALLADKLSRVLRVWLGKRRDISASLQGLMPGGDAGLWFHLQQQSSQLVW